MRVGFLILAGLLGPACGPGPQGPAGPAGPAGPVGPAGNKITQSIFCGGPLQGTSLSCKYAVDIFNSGDIYASAAIYGAAFQIGDSVFYSKDQVGAATATVIFTYDPDQTANGGFWSISLDRTSLVTTAVLQDPDAPSGQETWSMNPNKCVVNRY